ncbi:hypothetical protein BC834DRAFT_892735 [Gloeopeniophorella convolvens]|nr:hypothetical protein BC834DRAFT_892735 [Gloeopeniophorella convolvens]
MATSVAAGPSGHYPATTAPSQSYFDIVNDNLLRLGALTLEDFLHDPYQEPAPPNGNFLSNPLYHDVPAAPLLITQEKDGEAKSPQTLAPLFVLQQICSQTFGSIDALNYEIIEEEGKEKKRCILTITRPNGATRSYTSKPEFARKAEARAAAAAVAVDMGAIDFIKHGSPEAVTKRGLVLAPLDAPGSVQAPLPSDAEGDPSVKEIETCCVEWRAGRVKPRWVFLIDVKPTGKYGCALQVKLSRHLFRVYSVDVAYATFEEAKATCAADAIADGVLDFIKFGNGQTAPAEKRLFSSEEEETAAPPPPIALTLQGFFEALPRPFPEPVDDKTAIEINAPSWLNALVQSARGARFELKFIWTTDTKLGTHGAVLRLARPGEVRTFMVDPQFPKRADAKSAVCLAALSASVGAYVRSIGEALETKVSPETRTLVHESILPLLLTEYAKFWPGKLPELFEYTKDRDGCGCVLTLKLKEEPEEREKRSWSVPAEYRSKSDAKVIAVKLAFEQGAIEFLRFGGEPAPEGYQVILPPPREPKKAKRKGGDGAENDGTDPGKKPKLLSQAAQFTAATATSKAPDTKFSGFALLPPRPTPAVPMLLPRPGYVDPKPEPGEISIDPPILLPLAPPPVTLSTGISQRGPAKPSVLARGPPPRPAELPLNYARSEPPLPHPYGAREPEHQYGLGGARYDGPGAYAADPYYAPAPAPHAEPWRPPPHAGPRDALYRSYDSDSRPSFDYGYEHEPPRAYDGYERTGYDPGYTHEREHVYAPRAPSPPRVWEPGPRAATAGSQRPTRSRSPANTRSTSASASASYKEELLEYCQAHGHPHPQFVDVPDNAGGYRVWVVLGQERLELPTTYARVEDGEEKIARKVLQRLLSQGKGQA